MKTATLWLAMGILGGCQTGETADAGGDSDADTDADADSDSDSDPGTPESAAPFAAAFSQGAGSAVALGAPLVTHGTDLEGRDAAGEDDAHTAVENGVSRDSVVTDPACVAYSWAGLSVTITFTDCVLETTGQSLDGALTLAVELAPVVFTLTFDSLAIDADTTDGTIALSWTGPDGSPGVGFDVDLTYTTAGAASHIVLQDFTVIADATSAVIAGSGSLQSGAIDASFDATDVTWTTGNCHPTSGSVEYEDGGAWPVTITFLPTTPADGIVEVQVGPFPSAPVALLSACP